MGLEDDLLAELDKQAEPHAAWEAGKKEIQKGTAAVRGKADYTAGVKGPKLVERVETYATDLYTGMGRAGNGDPKILAHTLRTTLGQQYGAFRDALEIGDADQANQLVKTALVNEVGAAKLQPTLDKIALAPSDTRLAWGKKAVAKVGGTEYMTAATNPEEFAISLGQLKQVAARYKL